MRVPFVNALCIVSILYTMPCFSKDILPISPGKYYSNTPEDCNGSPSLMEWDGKKLISDYIYLDNITKVDKIGVKEYLITSETETNDDNTDLYGKTWLANVYIHSPTEFKILQYALGRQPFRWIDLKRCP